VTIILEYLSACAKWQKSLVEQLEKQNFGQNLKGHKKPKEEFQLNWPSN